MSEARPKGRPPPAWPTSPERAGDWRVKLAATLLLAGAVAGCGGGGGSSPTADTRPKGANITQGVAGTVRFLERRVDALGKLSGRASAVSRVARFVRVEIVEDHGGDFKTISSTTTDADGRFGIGGAFPKDYRVVAYPEVPAGKARASAVEVEDRAGNRYAVVTDSQPAVGARDLVEVDVLATLADPFRVAGAFNIVDVVQDAGNLWRTATGITPAKAIYRWESGGTDQPSTSFYDPVSEKISLLGGQGEIQDFTDTDEFDDVVIAHEYLHFLIRKHGHTSTPGGAHGGEDLVPHLAFDEGLADWYGALVTGSSLYRDTLGTGDGQTRCGFCDDLETSSDLDVRGIGSESSCYQILWDLVDGGVGEPLDDDGDGVALSSQQVLEAVLEFDPAGDVPYIETLLENLVWQGSLATTDVQNLLSVPIGHDISFPARDRDSPSSGRDVFPVPIAFGDVLAGSADSRTVPIGGLNVERGFDSIRYYRLEVAARRRVVAILTIAGSGVAPNDLDLYLMNLTNDIIRSSTGVDSSERIDTTLDPGVYLLAVFAFHTASDGSLVRNRGTYTLEVRP